MGSCTSTSKVRPAKHTKQATTSARDPDMMQKRMLSYKDFKGLRKLDDIESFYEIRATIGRGAFGEVFSAVHLLTGERRAIKMIKREKVNRAEILRQL